MFKKKRKKVICLRGDKFWRQQKETLLPENANSRNSTQEFLHKEDLLKKLKSKLENKGLSNFEKNEINEKILELQKWLYPHDFH